MLVCDSEKSESDDAGRTRAIVLGTVFGLLAVILVIVVVCYVAHRWPWLSVNRRDQILRGEMAFDGLDSNGARPATLRISPRNGHEPPGPSAPEQTAINLTELHSVRDQPTTVCRLDSIHSSASYGLRGCNAP